jgi:hypothetical protein
MDDFLYNLRRESDKRNRRQSGQQNYRGPDRRGVKDQRRGYARRNEGLDQLGELLPEIKSLLENIGENQKQLLAESKRKTMALENIAASLRMMSGNTQDTNGPEEEAEAVTEAIADVQTPEPVEEAEPVEAGKTDEADDASPDTDDTMDSEEPPRRSKREDVRKIALELRTQGKTYKEIAQYLDDNLVPTFSGKGGWHAPTIHKLCKE